MSSKKSASTPPSPPPNAPPSRGRARKVALAAVAGAHGVRGEVRLKLFGSLEGLTAQPIVHIAGREFALDHIKPAGKGAIARLAGITDRSTAESLRGELVEVDRSALPPLEDGEYYHADLIGLPCVDGDGKPLGTVVAVENYGAGDLLEIETEGGKTSLIPYRTGIADLEDGRIVLDPAFLA